jgi:hypothetical protein
MCTALKKYVVSKALTEEGKQKFVVIAILIFMAIFIIISAIILKSNFLQGKKK